MTQPTPPHLDHVFPDLFLDEAETVRRPRFDELLNQLAAHSGLFSRTTFHNIFGSLIRMVRDQNLNGVVILRTLNDSTFDMLAMPLYNMMSLDVFNLNQLENALPETLSSPDMGFILLLTNRLSAVLHWNSETYQAFRMDQGGWSFNPGDVRSLALHLSEWLGHDAMNAAVKRAPIDRRYDDRLSIIVSSLLSNLENRNRELTMALEREKELSHRMAESERMAAIGQMSSVIAHEIRNPLGLISLYAQLVQTQLEKLDPSQPPPEILFKNLAQIQDASQHLESILTELTQYSRPLELNLNPLNLQQFMEETVEFYRPKYEEKGVRLVTETYMNLNEGEAENLHLALDYGRMRQALINLMKNALEATESGKSVTVSLACRRDDEFIYLKVKDEGCGVPAEKQAKLFTPYFSTKSSGTGLGLAYIQKVMQAHGGSAKLLWSEAGQGSTFALLMPRQPVHF